MDTYDEAITAYLEKHPLSFGCCNFDSVVQMLFCCHQHSNGFNTEEIRAYFADFDTALGKLSLAENDTIFHIACDLVDTAQQRAFEQGILVGFHLYRKLQNL